MLSLHFIATLFACFAIITHAFPLSRRDVISPKITSPTKDSVWPVGSVQTVTWDTSNFPPDSQITNPNGKVILGFDENDSLNLDFEHPLAQGFLLKQGSVQITVPNVPPKDDYLIVLMGDSGNTSPSFTITKISAPASPNTSTTETLITTPIPITGTTITGGSTDSTSSSTSSGLDSNTANAPPAPTSTTSTISTTTSSSESSAGTSGASTSTSGGRSIRHSGTLGLSALLIGTMSSCVLFMI